jgi:uncharacterized membrane protein YraQ (UPF0718 family)/copper chaperone CopZ
MNIFHASWEILLALAPWLLLGMIVAGALHIWLPTNFLSKHLRGRAGVLKAVALGVPLPLCSCGVIPAGLGLKKDGASDGASVGFLISTPQTGVDSILVSSSFLGWPFAIFKVVAAFVTGIIGGLLTDALDTSKDTEGSASSQTEMKARRGLKEGFTHAMQILDTIWIWVIFGVVASAAITLWLPNAVFMEMSNWGTLPSMFAVLLVSLPLYVCATSSVPIAAALVAGGLPAGSALVFLMAGPATNLATMGALYRAFGRRITLIYLSTIIVFSIGFGLCFDVLIDATDLSLSAHHEHEAWWAVVSAGLLCGLIVYLAGLNLKRWVHARRASTSMTSDALSVSVSGMTCKGCVNKLVGALSARNDVEQVQVTLEPGQAVVQGTIVLSELRKAIKDTGFEPG